MNNLCTLLDNLSRNDITAQPLDNLSSLIASVVRDDLGGASKSLITNWVHDNGAYIDFFFALRPDWLVGTPDDKQVKMRISIDKSDKSWYAYLVMDCEDGEIESWGEREFNRDELGGCCRPVKYMLDAIRGQYEKKLCEENAKASTRLISAATVAKRLGPHVDAIKKICKETGVKLFSDCSLDGTSCLYVVPDCMDTVTDCMGTVGTDFGDNEISLGRFPFIDLGAEKFDPNYDRFVALE